MKKFIVMAIVGFFWKKFQGRAGSRITNKYARRY